MFTICFLFPGPSDTPCGGLKVIGEYANRLAQDGNQVHIAYAGSLFWTKKSLYFKLTSIVRYIQRIFQGFSCRNWFLLDQRVKEHYVFSLNHRHVPQADIYIASNPHTAIYLKDYPIPDNRKFYFIQGYENWGGITDKKLRETYHYPLQKIVISTWLKRIMDEEKVKCIIVPNGFDFNYFHKNISIEKKDKYKVAMIYSPIACKGCQYGLKALEIVKKRFPELKAFFLGSSGYPETLQEWHEFYPSPDKKTHNRILNESAIFLATSLQEGWGLPVGEAMICGQAVVCTDNPGYREMAVDYVNALICPPNDAIAMAEAICLLIENDELRIQIAQKGHQDIQKFNLDISYLKFKHALGV